MDLTGQQINDWHVLELSPERKYGRLSYKCQCKCGSEDVVTSDFLKRGVIKQCKKCGYEITRSKNRKLKPFEGLYKKLVKDADPRGIPVSLTYEEYLEFTTTNKCHYCERELIWTEYRMRNKGWIGGHNLDRMDNQVGYSKTNCVVCCPQCNRIKGSDVPYNTMIKIGQLLKQER